MALITTTAELKKHLSTIDNDFKPASLQSFIADAEADIVVPWIGREIFDVVSAAYAGNTLANKSLTLSGILQKAVVHLAFLLASDSGSFRISDSGYYVRSDAATKPVSDKKMAEFKKGRRESGYRALEQAIEYMEANIGDAAFAAYAGSAAHAYHRSLFINSAEELTRYYKKVSNSTYLAYQLRDAMERAERKYLKPLLGVTFFNALKAKLLAGNFSPAEAALLPLIKLPLAHLTMALGLPALPVEIDGTSLLVSSSPAYGNSENIENKAAASVQQIGAMASTAMATGMEGLDDLAAYLAENAGQLPGYILPEAAEDVNMNDPEDPTYFV